MDRRFAVVVLLFVIAGCSEAKSARIAEKTTDGKINAVCTTGMVADLVRNVGGPEVEVTQIMGEGVDPHLYKASPGDVSLLNNAQIIFYSGLHLEGKMSDLFERMADRKQTIAVTRDLN